MSSKEGGSLGPSGNSRVAASKQGDLPTPCAPFQRQHIGRILNLIVSIMTDNNTPTPDLQSILSTLASFAPPAAQQTPSPSVFANHDAPSIGPSQPPQPRQSKPEDPRLRPQGRSTPSNPPKSAIDPATITTWPDGLRCVTKIAAQNAQFAASIRKVCHQPTPP